MRPLTTLGELLAELPGSLMLRQLGTHWATEHPAYAVGGAVAMFHRWSGDANLVVVGDPADAVTAVREVRAAHPEQNQVVSVPHAAGERLVADDGYVTYDGWAYRWTDVAPPADGTGARWEPPDTAAEADDIVRRGFPDASMHVGHPDVRRWAGLRRDGRLVAVAADATSAPDLGFLASITSDPDARGTGAGAAVTAWATAELVRAEGVCGLWHMTDNVAAATLYTRLGFHDDDHMLVVGPG